MRHNEKVMERWMALELADLGRSMVVKRQTVSKLLGMDEPKVVNRAKEDHIIDGSVLRRIGDVLNESELERLRIPITFHSDLQVEQSLFLDDELAVDTLKRLDALNPLYEVRNGRLWISHAVVLELKTRWPTVSQISYH